MEATLQSAAVGLLSLIAISGLGRLLIRPLPTLPLHWYGALALLTGFALSSVAVQCLAIAGSGRTGFRVLGATVLGIGIVGHWLGRGRYLRLLLPQASALRTVLIGLLCLIMGVLVLIGIAPSTKIDELYYHMLAGRRIIADHGLRVYQFPYEQAIVPQMAYQITQAVFHATNTPDAGNLLSLGFGVTLWLLIYGIVTEQTGRPDVALMVTVISCCGLFPIVWHVTAGPHALGDLSMFTAVAALFFPGERLRKLEAMGGQTRSFASVLGAVCAASTKISMVPVAGVITAAALYRVCAAARIKVAAQITGLWAVVMGPLLAWTYVHTGSPFGAAFSHIFGPTVYHQAVLQGLDNARRVNQIGLRDAAFRASQFLNGGSIVLIGLGILTCCRQWKRFAGLLGLLLLQVVLIAKLLPHDFRFLGGLQYAVLVAGALGLASIVPRTISLKWAALLSVILLGPWLAGELFFVRPFAALAIGATSHDAFLNRYIALINDFRKLDAILPAEAHLYGPNTRIPALYSPRPVIYSIADWDRQTPLYRLLVKRPDESFESSLVESQTDLACGEVVYLNERTIIEAYRTPGRKPIVGAVIVQRCTATTSSGTR